MHCSNFDLEEFARSGFHLRDHLSEYLNLSTNEVDFQLSSGLKDMAVLHPGGFTSEELTGFYESEVGNAHILELAAWHLGSVDYILDTLKLEKMFAHGQVLDFGGGIGTHAIAAASLPNVKHVSFVDLNPQNREFVQMRVKKLGLTEMISIHRDLDSTGKVQFDTVVCLDVLEHLPNPSKQLAIFLKRMSISSVALMNWYFFKGYKGEYPFHVDDEKIIKEFFLTLQKEFLEIFHPLLITTRAYRPLKNID